MNIANKISLFRILSVPFFIACLYYSTQKEYLRSIALVIFLIAVISDAVDGFIARKSKLKSQAGLILDPLADKLLLLSAFIFLYILKDLPFWAVLVIISRDVLILLGTVVIYVLRQNINVHPSVWGKLTTFFQMSVIISVLLRWEFSYFLLLCAVVFTFISGAYYVRKGFLILYTSENSLKNNK